MIDLSVIVVNYNNESYLKNCLGSIYAFTEKINFEIIFVDNNSSDNSLNFVKSNFPGVKIIENPENLGFTRANNQGLKIYQGRYALLLNTDTILRPKALDRMVEFMDTHPKAGACGPKLLNLNGTIQHQGGIFARKFWLSKTPIKVDYVIGAALLVRREAVEKVGVLDENFFFSNEDLDWCRRIRKAGWDVYFVPQAEIVHHGGFTTKRFNRRSFVEGFRGGLYFAKKHHGNLIYQAYKMTLMMGMIPAIVFSFLSYPFLKNKERLNAYTEIFAISLLGRIVPEYEKNPVHN